MSCKVKSGRDTLDKDLGVVEYNLRTSSMLRVPDGVNFLKNPSGGNTPPDTSSKSSKTFSKVFQRCDLVVQVADDFSTRQHPHPDSVPSYPFPRLNVCVGFLSPFYL